MLIIYNGIRCNSEKKKNFVKGGNKYLQSWKQYICPPIKERQNWVPKTEVNDQRKSSEWVIIGRKEMLNWPNLYEMA